MSARPPIPHPIPPPPPPGDPATFSHREFSFTLDDDVYVRYQSFDSLDALMEGLRKNLPYKIDIGAMFSVKVLETSPPESECGPRATPPGYPPAMPPPSPLQPCLRSRVQPANFKALHKELVFDIDLTDYDDIRSCCSEAKVCLKCWRFMVIAIKVLDRALRGVPRPLHSPCATPLTPRFVHPTEDFGFQHLLWVYSGRRGVHCWVCDEAAIALSSEARTAVVEYLTLVRGGDQQAQKVHLKSPLHPSIRQAPPPPPPPTRSIRRAPLCTRHLCCWCLQCCAGHSLRPLHNAAAGAGLPGHAPPVEQGPGRLPQQAGQAAG